MVVAKKALIRNIQMTLDGAKVDFNIGHAFAMPGGSDAKRLHIAAHGKHAIGQHADIALNAANSLLEPIEADINIAAKLANFGAHFPQKRKNKTVGFFNHNKHYSPDPTKMEGRK